MIGGEVVTSPRYLLRSLDTINQLWCYDGGAVMVTCGAVAVRWCCGGDAIVVLQWRW